MLLTKRGQTVYEYAIIIGLVVLALSIMQVYLRRGIQAGIKLAADEVGLQKDSAGLETFDPRKGTMLFSFIRSTSAAQNQLQHDGGGQRTEGVNENSEVLPLPDGTPSRSFSFMNWEEE